MSSAVRVRPSSRVLVLDRQQRLLLLFGGRGLDPAPSDAVRYWFTPGGGVEDGEDLRTVAVRELAEETGLVVGPGALEGPVWLRRWQARWGEVLLDSRETFFVLRDVEHAVDVSGRTEDDSYGDDKRRWWTAAEIAASSETFAPGELAEVLPEVPHGPWTGSPRIVS